MKLENISTAIPEVWKALYDADSDESVAEGQIHQAREARRAAMKNARGLMGKSACCFGKIIGITGPYVFMLESGKYHWSRDLIYKFDQALKKIACPADSEPAEQAGLADPKGAEC